MAQKPLITPQTKVGELLEGFPELESVLVEIAPAFNKLRNPVLRRTVARVTSLAQAARVGNVSVVELVGRLREAAGQPGVTGAQAISRLSHEAEKSIPDWVRESPVVDTLDARPMIEAGEQPIGRVLQAFDRLGVDQVYELITPFEPAPLIDKAREKGMQSWSEERFPNEYHTYFMCPHE